MCNPIPHSYWVYHIKSQETIVLTIMIPWNIMKKPIKPLLQP